MYTPIGLDIGAQTPTRSGSSVQGNEVKNGRNGLMDIPKKLCVR